MMRLVAMVAVAMLTGCGTNSEGERCNPLRFTSDCDPGLTCVYPTAPSCGVSYCCVVDANGRITDTNPNCQPDPSLDSTCMLDLAVSPSDGAVGD